MIIEDNEINNDVEKFVSLIIEAKEKTMPDRKWYIEYDNDYIHIDLITSTSLGKSLITE